MSFTPSETEIIGDIVRAGRLAVEYTNGLDSRTFEAAGLEQSGTMYQLAIMGEAAKRLSADFRSAHPQIDWRGMIGFRDILVHHYHRLDLEEIWRVVTIEVPRVLVELDKLVPPEE